MNLGAIVTWLLAKRPIRAAAWRVARLLQEQDLSMDLVAKADWEASSERVRILRSRGMDVGPNSFIGRARFMPPVRLMEVGARCAILDDCVLISHDLNGLILGGAHVSKVRVRDNSVLMPGVYVYPGVSIGPNALVAPRSVVARDIPPNTFASGHPARPVCSLAEWLEECERRLAEDPGLFTLIPTEGGFREDLLEAWRLNLKTLEEPGSLSAP